MNESGGSVGTGFPHELVRLRDGHCYHNLTRSGRPAPPPGGECLDGRTLPACKARRTLADAVIVIVRYFGIFLIGSVCSGHAVATDLVAWWLG